MVIADGRQENIKAYHSGEEIGLFSVPGMASAQQKTLDCFLRKKLKVLFM